MKLLKFYAVCAACVAILYLPFTHHATQSAHTYSEHSEDANDLPECRKSIRHAKVGHNGIPGDYETIQGGNGSILYFRKKDGYHCLDRSQANYVRLKGNV